MKTTDSWTDAFDQEMEQAEAARASGNEGRARVCARRAAGIVIREYFSRLGIPFAPHSAYQNIHYLSLYQDTTPQVRQVAGHFLERINPEHELPIDAYLIAEARWMANILLNLS
jgi:RNA 3'-terminal phosphate cyclase